MDELRLRRKWTLRAHGRQVVFVKKPIESTEHVVMKALIWALYLPQFPDLTVEIPVGDKYKPDVVSLDASGEPLFWGEAGDVSTAKIRSLARRHRRTHFALAKWNTRLAPLAAIVEDALNGLGRAAPFDLLSFPVDAAERFIDDDGVIRVTHDDLVWVRRF
ncbi:MAG: hypothetical protein MUC34_05680 [Anaerolineae bacterium]|nr:hypothetical protein [Anaerolineae bacterium]